MAIFTSVSSILETISFFGSGIAIFIVILAGAIARGITKDKEDMLLYFITLSTFGFVLLFATDLTSSWLFVAGAIAVTIYALKYLRSSFKSTESYQQ